MGLPRSECFSIRTVCPDCGFEFATARRAKSVDGDRNRLVRRCHCNRCRCWFDEEISLVIDEVEMSRQDGEEKRFFARHSDDCPLCGRPLDLEDPYLSADEDELLEWSDVSEGIRRYDWFCLDCGAEFREIYRMRRTGARVVRHGMGPEGLDRCPNCGSPNANYALRPLGKSSWSLLCECRDCGCEFRLSTEEEFNHTWVVADRDGFYAGDDYEQLYDEPIAKIGGECPMCGRGVIAAGGGFVAPDRDPHRGLRGERCVDYECLGCFTQFTDHFATRVVGVEVIEQGRAGVRWEPPADGDDDYDEDIPF